MGHCIHLAAVLFLQSFLAILATGETNITTDQSALLALKARVISDPYGVLRNWNLSSSACDWVGVTCGTRHRRVISLNVSGMDLTGTIPPELGNLSFLVSLDMIGNHFGGILPENLAHLRRLTLIRLTDNNFQGEVPSLFSFLPRLGHLHLRNNKFTGLNFFLRSISNETKLEILDMSLNALEGKIPMSIGNLHNLRGLDMDDNHLSGPIPSSIGNMSRLEIFTMANNSIQGTIPEGIGNLLNLKYLILPQNRLTGSIPYSIFNISTLEVLSFAENKMSFTLPDDMCLGLPLLQGIYLSSNDIYGHIPSSISACSQLQNINLFNNRMTGTIPPEITNLEMLELLHLGYNRLTGTIPSEIGKLQNLQDLRMENNYLSGSIPFSLFNISSLRILRLLKNQLSGSLTEEFGNLTMLNELYISENRFTGVIPQRFSELQELTALDLGINRLAGSIPRGIFNISTLEVLSLTENNLTGKLPLDIGHLLPNLGKLYLGGNNLDGPLPYSILNCSELTLLDLSENEFTGPIPSSLGNLRALTVLNLMVNNFINESPSPELSFVTSLMNCRDLTLLAISYNPLNGVLPISIGNLSSSLQTIYATDARIKGRIPDEIGNLSGLATLYLSTNDLTGFIPKTLGGLSKLQQLYLPANRISGSIPSDICKLKKLGALDLGENQLNGSLPECFGDLSSLREIYLNLNNLSSGIPDSIWNLKDLLVLDISSNSLTNALSSHIGNLKMATSINLSVNQLSNDIPATIGGLQSLTNLSLAHNRFQGSIPESIGDMLNLVSLDLSYNKISGRIPKSLEALKHLEHFNVSFNELSGDIPNGGPFSNFSGESFMFNSELCGNPRFQVPRCPGSKHQSKAKKVLRVAFITLGIATFVVIITLTLILAKYRRKNKPTNISDVSSLVGPARLSYYELLQATDGYSESNFLGRGGFSSVYKGVLKDGTAIAVKVLNMELEGALRSFDDECEVLRNLRHRNLAKVLGSCSNQDFKALVLEFMPNGSLEKWLYSESHILNVTQRLNIMIDVASALEYLHHGYATPVVHCDLKPGNVLLDANMVAHVSDFGISKLLGEGESMKHTRTLATLEFGLEGNVSTRCDVYSYGIMLLEIMTGKRPSDEMFDGQLNLKNWVQTAEQCISTGHRRQLDKNRGRKFQQTTVLCFLCSGIGSELLGRISR
ncbi:putative LRR receptor-like serine/threonine-protein kinase [Dorcoceras hygrometricum]|uniref:Putative LRR receptor-like serine/threonine-protein kinase n=1 Tax=Dorcoceras hygrometricum TaxID=472368 RepID=A0A2Z7CWA5_9LAMI|nr:putative LRR receptor-like serine/threonine-protein kinase [Dorcoceras hygrometricum]